MKEEEMNNKKTKDDIPQPQYIRLKPSTKELFDELAAESGINPDSMMKTLLSTYTLKNSESIYLERVSEIQNITHHITAITDAFNFAFNYNAETEERVRGEFADRIDADATTILKLQEENSKFNDKIEIFKQQDEINKEEFNKIAGELDNLREQLRKEEEKAETYKKSNSDLSDLITSFKQDRENNLELISKIELLNEQITKQNNDIITIDNKKNILETENENLSEKIQQLIEYNEKAITELKQQQELDLSNLRLTLSNENKRKELDLRQEYEEKLQKKEADHSESLQEYLKQLQDARLEILQLKEDSLASKIEASKTVTKED